MDITAVVLYAIPQKITGHCGGFPASCFPATTYDYKQENLGLDLMHGEHICVKNNPCLHEGRCVAIDATNFKCVCHPGYSGVKCDIVNSTIIDNGRTCPNGYQAETCMCFESTCNGAKFEGDSCISTTGKAQIICRPGNPGHVILFNKQGYGSVRCPSGATIVGCSFWSSYPAGAVHGQGLVSVQGDRYCSVSNNTVWVQARCKQFECGCKNGGHCNEVTGLCECLPSYYGTKCETYDFCSYYEDKYNTTACKSGGICTPAYKKTVSAIGGDMAGDTCIFPFDYGDYTFNSCIEDNTMVGPPFSCAGQFALSSGGRRSYIDLGSWSPGPRYTVAAWVKPGRVNTMRQTVVGGASACNDFGFNFNSGTFRGYLKLSTECTRDLVAGKKQAKVGQWYMVAVTSNATHARIYLNGKFMDSNTVLLNHIPTTDGFWIGAAYCCQADYFRGMIKNVKVWNRELTNDEINRSMYNLGTKNSTTEALHDGLVGHWELGDTVLPSCSSINSGIKLGTAIDHGGEDWILKDGEIIYGIHCNISRFVIPKGMTVLVKRYNGTVGGTLDITAQEVVIDGYLDANGAGYRGGMTSNSSGSMGTSGESYTGLGSSSLKQNNGGGGAGSGGYNISDGMGRSGGGGGYGTAGTSGIKVVGDRTGLGSGGQVYGDDDINTLYMGSGGGSGGNAVDLTTNPKGGQGGNGGGAIKILAERSITISGVISVAGESGEGDIPTGAGCMGCPDSCDLKSPVRCQGNSTVACWDKSGPGGGGSGGTIYLSAKLVNVGYQKLWAMGGDGGTGGSHCCGGTGGLGRIRIDSNILQGIVGDSHGTIKMGHLNDLIIDHSQAGQKQIVYTTTKYGNEVYRGCFSNDPNSNTLAYHFELSNKQLSQLTPDYCKQLCRQKNYKFSGTSNHTNCYCDNALDMTKKVPDHLCNTSCSGDQLWMCGGVTTVQVFGPPPSSPAKGYNVIPKCLPWCVTADAQTSHPKWGQCSSTPAITDWDVKCQCRPGTTGANCDQVCKTGTYGIGCRRNCTCNMTNTASCDVATGACTCKPGFMGDDCNNTCPQGFYGDFCERMCSCSSSSVCNPQTGECVCRSGWMGPDCNFPCPRNTYGVNCSKQCGCKYGSCDPTNDGACNCYPGYKLPFCSEKCDPFNYGVNCEQTCDCNSQACDPMTGLCKCAPGYVGSKCNQLCPSGTWGQNCAHNCTCQQGFSCDAETGECNCGPGFIGLTCDHNCTGFQFGIDCAYTCSCVADHTLSCDNIHGTCNCKPGYRGASCELSCDLGYYGDKCTKLCTCKNGGTCDKATGKCMCAPGFTGANCENKCQKGFYGNSCSSRCTSTCSDGSCNVVTGTCCTSTSCPSCPKNTAGSGTGCNKICNCINGQCLNSGACMCSPGWIGAACDTPCSDGHYGSACASVCNCVHGDCDLSTGKCNCYFGYTGADCSQPCKANSFGPNCTLACPDCGQYSYPSCDPGTGACKCSAGYTGPLCDKTCPPGTYGIKCYESCICNSGNCDPVTGSCDCYSGFQGPRCEDECDPGTWGPGCIYKCQCSPHSDGCSAYNGKCHCKPGFTGIKCQESCPVGFYGQNCSQACRCDLMSSTCSPIDGKCLCFSGYKGDGCALVCSRGYWGRDCSQQCECNGNGGCNPFNGQCDCAPGYTGTNCQKQCDQDLNWGKDCTYLCSCNGEHCDHRDGTCRCSPGKFGHSCEKSCNEGYFGFQCAQTCGCQNSAKCNAVTGSCSCAPGWSGQFCDQPCPDNHYGIDCGQICPDCYHGNCDPEDGFCHCNDGYIGEACNTTLPGHQQQQYISSPSQVLQSGINLTVGGLVGLIVGFIVVLLVVTLLSVYLTRRFSIGRFAGTEGAMKFEDRGFDEPHPNEGNTTSGGFINPVHEAKFDETEMDQKSVSSSATSGIASAMVDSDEEDQDNNQYFKDSNA
ncbi:Multiple epidermal growth factor-like domains protein 10 [Mactra antiquata]